MRMVAASYTRVKHRRQRTFGAVIALGFLSGCSGISLSDNAEDFEANTPQVAQQTPASDDVSMESGDQFIISKTIETAKQDDAAFAPMAWANPSSGNTGTIWSLVEHTDEALAGCAEFVTSANTIDGVKAYQGRSCPDDQSNMRIVKLEPYETEQQ